MIPPDRSAPGPRHPDRAGPRILPGFPETLSQSAVAQLARLGAEVLTGSPVTSIDPEGVTLGERRVAARTVLWPPEWPPLRSRGPSACRSTATGRVPVAPDLSLPGSPNIFVVGDLAALQQDGRPVPGVAPAAIQEGSHAARNIARILRGKPTLPFRYHDKGSLATIGRASAVADFGRLRLSGPIAWLAWLLVHIFFLIGFRNRLRVLFEWVWAYWTYDRGRG